MDERSNILRKWLRRLYREIQVKDEQITEFRKQVELLHKKNRLIQSKYVKDILALYKKNNRLSREIEEQRLVIDFYVNEYYYNWQDRPEWQDGDSMLNRFLLQ